MWLSWRELEATRLVVQSLRDRRDMYKEFLADGSAGYPTCEATALKYADIVGRIAEIDTLLDLLLVREEDEDEQPSSGEDDAPGLAGPGLEP